MEVLQRTANRGSIATGAAYEIENSLKFEADNSEELQRNISTAGSRQTATVSMWIKKTELGAAQYLFTYGNTDNDDGRTLARFQSDDTLRIMGGNTTWRNTNRVFRDTSAWYHIVIAFDTTQSTANDRIKLYINGVQETSFSTINNPSLNGTLGLNFQKQVIGYNSIDGGSYFSGYMTEIVHQDGTASTPTEFGETDSDTGIWIPKDVDGVASGTNGFYLDFEDASNLGNDVSGGTDFTLNNITSADQATDTPTNNFATCTSIAEPTNSVMVFSEGKTKVTTSSGGLIQYDANFSWFPTILPAYNKGKWYVEAKIIEGAGGCVLGVCPNLGALDAPNANPARYIQHRTYNTRIQTNLSGSADTSSYTGWFTYSDNDICTVALDAENQRVTFGKNGDWMDSSGGLTNSTPTYWISYSSGDWANYGGFVGVYGSESTTNGHPDWEVNFGGYTSFSISSANSDGNGYGTFEYAVPSGFYSICTKNLAEFG